MKKIYGLKFLGLVAILAAALVFIGIDFVQGQVKIQKGKPPWTGKQKYTWSAVILEGFDIRGIEAARYDETLRGWVYEDLESNVNVNVEIRRAPFDDGVEMYWTRFTFEIFYPIQIDLEFDPYDAWFYPDTPDAQCLYPGGLDSGDPMSMLYFMRDSLHPHPEYDSVSFRINTDRSVNPDDIDYEQWTYLENLGFTTGIKTPPMTWGASTCEELNLSEFSSIEFGGDNDYGYFERIGPDTWIAVAGMEKGSPDAYSGPGTISEDDAWATDCYQICVVEQINKKKTRATYDAIFSAQGQFDIKFAILFIRTEI
ncbi:MAG: hypothetical protein JSV17_02355 [Candidatus Aminicenantes bacterium]|nr:MAG: hypothetical protein JSV17_02355 [Candidatus Aminicenantes bacterium]